MEIRIGTFRVVVGESKLVWAGIVMVVALVLGFALAALRPGTVVSSADLAGFPISPACRQDLAAIAGPWGSAEVQVEVADTAASRERGLMFRSQQEPGYGMLFIYPEPGRVALWMRNTMIPLDMLFFSARGDLRHIHLNAQPHDETPIFGGTDIMFALEVPAGDVQRLGIVAPATLRHPAVDQAIARWRC